MQLFMLLRGHQGSGKSTFAQEKMTEFKQTYPNATIVHIENDILLTDENGVYTWSPQAVDKAQQYGLNKTKETLKLGKANPSQDILIINSNTNQKSSACIHLLQMARKHGFHTEVYRLHNFFDNTHNVKEKDVLAAYIKLNNNKLRDEIHVAPIKPMSDEIKAKIDKMTTFEKQALPFDETQNTYITHEYLTYGRRNFVIKNAKLYPSLRVLKYARKVFYENRFDDALLEMRGTVIDEHGRIIVRPFKKVFNYSERISKKSHYPISISDDKKVNAVVKVNGFLGVCTYVSLDDAHPSYGADFDNQVLYSTTGSLDSDFAKMTKAHCQKYEKLFKQYPNHTFLFEVTDESDVHIIKENFGETFIGLIDVATGRQYSEDELDTIADTFNQKSDIKIIRPQTIKNITFGELKTLLKTVKHEGFMVFDTDSNEMLFKLKSPYYLVSKFLGRSKSENIGRKLDKRHVDEEFYPLIDYIKENKETFNSLSELDKIAFIQAFIEKMV